MFSLKTLSARIIRSLAIVAMTLFVMAPGTAYSGKAKMKKIEDDRVFRSFKAEKLDVKLCQSAPPQLTKRRVKVAMKFWGLDKFGSLEDKVDCGLATPAAGELWIGAPRMFAHDVENDVWVPEALFAGNFAGYYMPYGEIGAPSPNAGYIAVTEDYVPSMSVLEHELGHSMGYLDHLLIPGHVMFPIADYGGYKSCGTIADKGSKRCLDSD